MPILSFKRWNCSGLGLLFLLLTMILSAGEAEAVIMLGVDVKVVALYQPTVRSAFGGREAADLLPPMQTNLVMRGWWKWGPGFNAFYDQLKASIAQLKQKMPNVIYQGGISASYIVREDTWADGSAISHSDFAKMLARDKSGNPIPWGGDGYLADVASPRYRKYLLGWSQKQIDAGVDSLFLDEVYLAGEMKIAGGADRYLTYYQYARYVKMLTSSLKSYAASKGRNLLITLNCGNAIYFGLRPSVAYRMQDYVTVSFNKQDFVPPFTLREDWTKINATIREKMGRSVPIVAFIDWGPDDSTALKLFSNLTRDDQIALLGQLDSATRAAGVLFAYPVFIRSPYYDSVREGTYDTIAALARGASASAVSTEQIAAVWSVLGVAVPSLPISSRDLFRPAK